jgi:hypothetical protein
VAIQYSDKEFIKLYRKLINWEWYKNTNTKSLFIHLLLRANWKDGSWKGIQYKRGELITSLDTLSAETGLSKSQVRTALNHMISTGEIAERKIGRSRIVSIVSYDAYQDDSRKITRTLAGKSHGDSQEFSQDDDSEVAGSSHQYKNSKEHIKKDKEEKEKTKTADAVNPFGWAVE